MVAKHALLAGASGLVGERCLTEAARSAGGRAASPRRVLLVAALLFGAFFFFGAAPLLDAIANGSTETLRATPPARTTRASEAGRVAQSRLS